MPTVEEVKLAAAGRWPEILEVVGGIPSAYLDPKHEHPCPRCGGTTRFRLIDADKGAVYCNQCFSKGCGDGISSIKWARGIPFTEALKDISDHLGIAGDEPRHHHVAPKPSFKKPASKPQKTYRTLDDAIAATESGLGPASKRYEYHDAGGNVVLVALRWDQGEGNKTFRQISKRTDGWVRAGFDGKNPIYNRQAVIAHDDVIFLVEGEKAADAVNSLGLVATTSPMGSGSGDKADWSPLTDRDVCILPDNDKKGLEYLQAVGMELSNLTPPARMKVVELPGLNESEDVVDWLDQHDAAEPQDLAAQLRDMADAAEEWFPEGVEPKIRSIPLDDLLEKNPALSPAIVHGLIRRGEVANVVSGAKRGKSWLVYGLAYSIATGKMWLGHFQCEQTRVLVIDNELHQPTLSSRLKTVADAMDILPYECGDRLEILSLRGRLKDLYDIERMSRDWGDKYGLIVCDAFYRILPSNMDENSNGHITTVFNILDKIAQRTGAAWVNIHHSSKGSQGGKSVTDIGSGAGAQSRAADAHIVLNEHQDENCAVLEAAVRSFPPVEPLPLRWSFPLWHSDHEVDPKAVKGRMSHQEEKQRENDRIGKEAILDALERDGKLSARRLRAASGGMSRERLEKLLYQLCQEGRITESEATINGKPAKEYELRDGIFGDYGEWPMPSPTQSPTLPLSG